MKKIYLIVCVLSLLPLASLARLKPISKSNASRTIVEKPISERSFSETTVERSFCKSNAACATTNLGTEATRLFNQTITTVKK